ncbi:MAG: hypothetical protein JW885_09135 [Deltaproteobacteria bacterium]|nr:hypothetical protein [Candidatus Zymogenaceae bacterium]
MNTAERIIKALSSRAVNDEITDITIGRIYAAVTLKSGGFGVAHLEGAHGTHRASPQPDAENGVGDLTDMLFRLGDAKPLASALGCAAAAALAAADIGPLPEGDVLDRLAVSDGDRVVMVGGFPIEEALRERGAALSVYDRSRGLGDMDELPTKLHDADLVIVTATAIINNTIDDILKQIRRARETVILGPSTILAPEAFRYTPVTRLFGVVFRDASASRQAIADGGGTRSFIRYAKKVEAAVPG